MITFLMGMLCYNFNEHDLMQLCNRGGTPLPDDQLTLEPTSSVLGGKLSFDSYNNGGEWLNSVHDVGASLVRALYDSFNCVPRSSLNFLQVGFVHAEDQYWEDDQHTGGGKAYKSVSLGPAE